MIRDVRERPPDGIPHDPRARWVGARARAAVIAAALIAGVLAGCGGGGGESSTTSGSTFLSTSSPATTSNTRTRTPANPEGPTRARGSQRAVRTAVEAVLTSGDPTLACRKYVTERYLKDAYGGRRGCVQAQQPGSAAASLESFTVLGFNPGGGLAKTKAVPVGGPYDGHTVYVGLRFGPGDHYRVLGLGANIPVGP